MKIARTPEEIQERYDRIFKRNKDKGLTDMEADIMTLQSMYHSRTHYDMAEKYNKTPDEIEEIIRNVIERCR